MALFELTDEPWDAGLEVGSSAGRPVVRLRRGTPVTADMVRMLNELLDDEAESGRGDQEAGTGAETPVTGAAASAVAHTVVIVLRS